MSLFDKTTSALGTTLNMRMMEKKVIQSNIANSETPGYHAKKIDFNEALARAIDLDGVKGMSTSNENHFAVGGRSLANVRPEIYENPLGSVSNDGNTVDMENEMASLAENSIMYKAAVQMINKKLAALRYAITEGR